MRLLLMLAGLAAMIGLAVPAHADSTDDQFLAALGQAGIGSDDPGKAVAAGKSVCTMANTSNMRMVNVVIAIKNANSGLNFQKAADFTRIAANAYCPDTSTDDINTLPWAGMG
jgi:Protein of unknown function (DUF732)